MGTRKVGPPWTGGCRGIPRASASRQAQHGRGWWAGLDVLSPSLSWLVLAPRFPHKVRLGPRRGLRDPAPIFSTHRAHPTIPNAFPTLGQAGGGGGCSGPSPAQVGGRVGWGLGAPKRQSHAPPTPVPSRGGTGGPARLRTPLPPGPTRSPPPPSPRSTGGASASCRPGWRTATPWTS